MAEPTLPLYLFFLYYGGAAKMKWGKTPVSDPVCNPASETFCYVGAFLR